MQLWKPVMLGYITYHDLTIMSFEDFLDLQELINAKEFFKAEQMKEVADTVTGALQG